MHTLWDYKGDMNHYHPSGGSQTFPPHKNKQEYQHKKIKQFISSLFFDLLSFDLGFVLTLSSRFAVIGRSRGTIVNLAPSP